MYGVDVQRLPGGLGFGSPRAVLVVSAEADAPVVAVRAAGASILPVISTLLST
jgi:hypothetical protein